LARAAELAPPSASEHKLWLDNDGRLEGEQPTESGTAADGYRYDPWDPTPSVGGPVLLSRDPVVDNRELEARPDVLTYTTASLPAALEAIGPVRVELWVRASRPHFDVFARVCDVDAAGISRNVCDALARVAPERFEQHGRGLWRVDLGLWPCAHRFAAGHRIRLQLSSGAHPRYARNPGTDEDPYTATTLEPVDIEVVRGAEYPSALMLSASASREFGDTESGSTAIQLMN
jgi:putative CocE/NonD family hydrolase